MIDPEPPTLRPPAAGLRERMDPSAFLDSDSEAETEPEPSPVEARTPLPALLQSSDEEDAEPARAPVEPSRPPPPVAAGRARSFCC